MTEERWKDIRQQIKDSFTILEEYTDDLDPGSAECLEFQGPGGAGILRVAFCIQPKVLDKKTLYSHRAGGDVRVDYTYSDTDEVSYMVVERWDESKQDWVPIDAKALF
jgi:hypothetical protein